MLEVFFVEVFWRQGFLFASRSCLCRSSEKSIQHLFMDCYYAVGFWHFVLNLNVAPEDLFLQAIKVRLSSQSLKLWVASIVYNFMLFGMQGT